MLTKIIFLVSALYTQSVYSSYLHHGPTALPVVLHDGYLADTHDVAAAKSAHLATLSHQSQGGSYGSQGQYHGDLKYHGPTALPVVLHDGYLADSHEVAAAKSAHLATLSHQSQGGSYGSQGHYHGDLKYHGPTALPVALHDGFLADTHEVAAAKSAHLATLSHQSQGGSYGSQGHYHGDLKYHGPTALPVVLHDGFLADTHEVAAAKSAHLATLSHQSQGGSYGRHGGSEHTVHGHHADLRYHGPTALPHVLHDGHIADTHEVVAAKAEHYAAVAKARAHGGYQHGSDHSGQYTEGYGHSGTSEAYRGYNAHASYHGAIAKPVVLHNGHIADTYEVAAAKAEHYAAVAKAGSRHESDHSGAYRGYGAHGPIASPVVLASGYLADTHDVAHAKQHHIQALNQARHHVVNNHY